MGCIIKKIILYFTVTTVTCACGGEIAEETNWLEIEYGCGACRACIGEAEFRARLRARRASILLASSTERRHP